MTQALSDTDLARLKEAAAVDFDQLERTLEMCERDQGHNPGMISISVERFRSLLETAKRSLAERDVLAGEVERLKREVTELRRALDDTAG